MRTRLVAGFCLAIVTLAVLSARQQAPAPPLVLALVVEVQPGAVGVLSAQAVAGVIRKPSASDLVRARRGPTEMLVEYTLKPASKSAQALATGVFQVSFVGIREDEPGPYHPPASGPPRAKTRVLPIAVPDVGAVSIAFAIITPADGVPPDQWVRTPIGEVSVPVVQR